MKLLLAMWRWELRLQRRSTRFRLAVLGYLALSSAPPAVIYFSIRHHTTEHLGPASYLAQTLQVQPYLTFLLVVLVAGNRSGAGALTEMWSVLAAASVGNGGYLLRRWLTLLAILVPVSLVPMLVSLGFALAAGGVEVDGVTWIAAWALAILPIVIAVSAFWLACVTITGGELGALATTFVVLPFAVEWVNHLLLRWHLTLSGYSRFFGFQQLTYWISWTLPRVRNPDSRFNVNHAATEAPLDLVSSTLWILPQTALMTAMAGLLLGLAVAFLRRTRRDLKPRPVPETHQLRTFLKKVNRQRQRFARDGALGAPDRLAAVIGLVVFSAAVFGWLHRQLSLHELARERYEAETAGGYEPLPAQTRLDGWAIRGRIERDGRVDLSVTGRLEHPGPEPLASLAFSLNEALEIGSVASPSRRLTTTRAWDRLRVDVDPPVAAGETVQLEMRLAGVPRDVDFNFGRGRGDLPFARKYNGMMHARFPRDLSDFSRSWVRRSVTPRRIDLAAPDLTPLPRTTTWQLTEPEDTGGNLGEAIFGQMVPVEISRNRTALEIDLEAPPEWFLADTCGHVSVLEGGRSRLRGSCQTSLTQLKVAGGALEAVHSGGAESSRRVSLAFLPEHRDLAKDQLDSLALVASLSDRAWPGMPGLEGLVVLEWPPEPSFDLKRGMSIYARLRPELVGRLLLLPERSLIEAEGFRPETLVAQLLSRDLLERRELAADQELVFRHFFRSLMIRRMGLDGGRGATVSGKPWLRQVLVVPILSAKQGQDLIWRRRLPAVLAQIESRLGGDHFYAGIESFLSAAGKTPGDETPGTIEELFAELERRSGISLQRTYDDHFTGGALPILRLEEVSSAKQNGGWRVDGLLRNTGTGEAVCPVIVKTEVAELKLTVTVDSETASPFSVATESRPHTVLLDPELTCYRFLLKTSPALERANLLD